MKIWICTSINHDKRVKADTQSLNEEKLPCHPMIMTENVRFDQAYHDWMIKFVIPKGVSSHGDALFFTAAPLLPHFASQQARRWRKGFPAYVLRTIM